MAGHSAMDPMSWEAPDLQMEEWTDSFTSQKEWGVGRKGLLSNSVYLLLAQFLGGIGAGAALLSMFLERAGADWYFVAGYIVAVGGKGFFHIMFLGHPERAWRAVMRVASSWISRGIIVLGIFSAAGLVYILWPLFEVFGEAGVGQERALAITCGALLTFLIVYDGFLLREAAAIAAWNMSLMVILFPIFSALGGVGLVGALYGPIHGEVPLDIHALHEIEAALLAIGAAVLAGYLLTLYNEANLRVSAWELITHTRLRWVFWTFVIGGGIVVPLIFATAALATEFETDAEVAVLAVIALVAVVGDYAFKFVIFSIGGFSQQYAPTKMPFRYRPWSMAHQDLVKR